MIKYSKPPTKVDLEKYKKDNFTIIFLAGSIDMGKSKPWAEDIFNQIIDQPTENNILLLNPRRSNWDTSWKQEITNPKFKEQVDWELDGLDASSIVVVNILADSKSPITLMELGLHIKDTDKELFVCCPKGFYRKGNVDIICDRYNVKVYDDFDEMVEKLKEKIL